MLEQWLLKKRGNFYVQINSFSGGLWWDCVTVSQELVVVVIPEGCLWGQRVPTCWDDGIKNMYCRSSRYNIWLCMTHTLKLLYFSGALKPWFAKVILKQNHTDINQQWCRPRLSKHWNYSWVSTATVLLIHSCWELKARHTVSSEVHFSHLYKLCSDPGMTSEAMILTFTVGMSSH